MYFIVCGWMHIYSSFFTKSSVFSINLGIFPAHALPSHTTSRVSCINLMDHLVLATICKYCTTYSFYIKLPTILYSTYNSNITEPLEKHIVSNQKCVEPHIKVLDDPAKFPGKSIRKPFPDEGLKQEIQRRNLIIEHFLYRFGGRAYRNYSQIARDYYYPIGHTIFLRRTCISHLHYYT